LRSGRIGEDGDGAIGNFREALALDEHNSRARQGLTLAPKDEKVRALQGRVELAQRVVAYNRAGEEDLRSGRIGEDGDGAIGNFREALALDEHNSRARQAWRRPKVA
ncbi:hypothetical protein C7E15_19410, partial [Stenotrophomonas maltophilia]